MHRILIDCDTGGDDAAAISLALASPDIEVLGITTCMGNLTLENTTQNTRELISFLGTKTPIAKGSYGPLTRERWVGSAEDRRLPLPGVPEKLDDLAKEDAVTFMANTLQKAEGKITLLPLAPLTNIAKLMMLYPDLVKEKVDKIILMGGGVYTGNTTGPAELNFYADPEAARAVFEFPLPVVMLGLDVCYKGYVGIDENERWKDIDNPFAQAFYHVTRRAFFWRDPPRDRAIVYDSLTTVYLLHPEIFEGLLCDVKIECDSELCDGMSTCDVRAENPRHLAVMDLDRDAYIRIVDELLRGAKGRA